MAGEWTLLYDRDCGFCRWSLAKVLAWDRGRRLRPAALQDPEADELLADTDGKGNMESWHLVSPDGDVRSAGTAIGPLMRLLPGGAPIAAIAERFPRATKRAYRWVADHRSAFGRRIGERARARADAQIRQREGGGDRSAAAPDTSDY